MTYPKHPVTVTEMETAAHKNDIHYLGDKKPTLLDQTEAVCPSCTEGRMGFKLTTGTYQGQTRVRLAHLQCSAWPNDPRHGYGPRSPWVDQGYKYAPHSVTRPPVPAREAPSATLPYRIVLIQGDRTIEINPNDATITLKGNHT